MSVVVVVCSCDCVWADGGPDFHCENKRVRTLGASDIDAALFLFASRGLSAVSPVVYLDLFAKLKILCGLGEQ